MARFSEQSARCNRCGATWKRHEEKETDVHFSLTFLEDAIDDVFDRAIVISADGDHIPAIRKIKSRLPRKQYSRRRLPGDINPPPFGSVYRLMDGFRSAITGMFSDDGPLSGNAARKMD
jgi:NYN domain